MLIKTVILELPPEVPWNTVEKKLVELGVKVQFVQIVPKGYKCHIIVVPLFPKEGEQG